MNIDQAKAVPMSEILAKLDAVPERHNSLIAWYSSPLRNEKTPSFQLNLKRNFWYDFGEGIGGDTVNFVCAYLKACREDHTVTDALRWIKNMMGNSFTPSCPVFDNKVTGKPEKRLLLKSIEPISHLALEHYLKKREIPLALATKHLKEVCVHNKETKKSFFALGFKNEDGGYEVRNPFFKGCVGTKTITFVRGKKPKPDGVHLFEGFMDFLSAVTDEEGGQFNDDAIILNSLSCIRHAMPFIQNYGYKIAYTWMDNDDAGKKATKALTEFFKTEAGLQHMAMNEVYKPHQDVNAWHVSKCRL